MAIDPYPERIRQQQKRFTVLEDRIETEIKLSDYIVLERSLGAQLEATRINGC